MFKISKLTLAAATAALTLATMFIAPIGASGDEGSGGGRHSAPSTAQPTEPLGSSYCSGYGCDGKNPNLYTCSNDANTPAAKKLYGPDGRYYGVVELRYSPSCRTVWARTTGVFTCIPGDSGCVHSNVHRNSDGREYHCSSPSGADYCYTAMVYDAGVTSYAYGDVDSGLYFVDGRTASF